MYNNNDDISNMKNTPLQQDLFDWGIYKLSYLLMECHKDKEVVDLNPERFFNLYYST